MNCKRLNNDGSAADAGFSLSVFQDQRPGPVDFFRHAGLESERADVPAFNQAIERKSA
jgi:hypothetical protein